MGIFNDVCDLFKTLSDAKQEINEAIFDGFYEQVICGESDYKTSFDIEKEASKKIWEANALYRKYVDMLKYNIKVVENSLAELNSFKYQIQNTAVKTWHCNISRYKNVAYIEKMFYHERVFDFLRFDTLDKIKEHSIATYNNTFQFPIYSSIMKVTALSSFSGNFISPTCTSLFNYDMSRKNRAREYLSKSRDYESTVSLHICKIKHGLSILENIKDKINRVYNILNKLYMLLNSINTIMSGINRVPGDREEKLILSSIYVVQGINSISNIPLVNENGYPNDNIENLICNLDNVISHVKLLR